MYYIVIWHLHILWNGHHDKPDNHVPSDKVTQYYRPHPLCCTVTSMRLIIYYITGGLFLLIPFTCLTLHLNHLSSSSLLMLGFRDLSALFSDPYSSFQRRVPASWIISVLGCKRWRCSPRMTHGVQLAALVGKTWSTWAPDSPSTFSPQTSRRPHHFSFLNTPNNCSPLSSPETHLPEPTELIPPSRVLPEPGRNAMPVSYSTGCAELNGSEFLCVTAQ